MLRDIWLIFGREMTQRLRQPFFLVMGLAQPLLFMFFFGPLLTKYVQYTPGFPPGDTWTIFAPALMLQMVLVGSSLVGMGLLAEYRSGVLERLRATPVSPSGLLLGKVATIAANVLVQSGLIVLLCHLVFDLDPPPAGLAVSMLMVALLSSALASFSYGFALRIRSEEGLPALLNAVLLPLLLLSGTLLPITEELAPGWLYQVSRLNPVAYVMDATRATFRGDFGDDSVIPGIACVVTMLAFAIWFAVRSFSREQH